ncbi:autophagy protein 16, interacts with Atg12p-Atg5p [Friedmanniomyces endolithicus]|uniref:Autophagy protein 16, interacts with Atg12p-Atg5p n=1 Tax=Friedmanniomyces endolithicus TaxID=329885 RepID=A0AAN6R0D4_9PEZI|nr:autophagy protein 16, interacts with Atg12p-Atg5p [Friedmanniomyces endolithicus]KAK0778591.1 autophagy protein 16, interacts with Atg12p-Atg5p [Friedmanniomyces endolithicus]KAK0785994.1 autophagy protein 16, interacts with Atg12p-Atg5p [Friedmanniomyces endolithicus]KAK0814524.1 autophagy protein 16, interacts with Atg12p-Atg5p [Friedmanniomyces endolithicus]KAK0850560.1 autophagy protein 16, interacts with Atg12p-Atg5p [Friedmanniomyces endolithicus]
MSDWIEQYSAALTERDAREQAHKVYIDAYTRLADRTATLAANAPATTPQPPTANLPKSKPTSKDPDPTPNDLLSSLRTDLSTTQKARRTLANQVADLTLALSTLQSTSATSTTQLALLTRQKADTERKLRDRDEELRGKNRMVVLAQDEMVAQGLQLSLAEQKAEGLERENRELVARWMERMGKEAERVNRDSKWE